MTYEEFKNLKAGDKIDATLNGAKCEVSRIKCRRGGLPGGNRVAYRLVGGTSLQGTIGDDNYTAFEMSE